MNRKHAGYTGVNLNLDAVIWLLPNKDKMQANLKSWEKCYQQGLFFLHMGVALSSVGLTVWFGIPKGRVSAWWGKATWGHQNCSPLFNDTSICPYQGEHAPLKLGIHFSLLLIWSQSITALSHFIRWNYCCCDWVDVLDGYQTEHGVKLICWTEYVFTAAMTSHVILHLGGMWDIRTQLIAYASQALLMVVGLAQDLLRAISLSAQRRHSQERAAWALGEDKCDLQESRRREQSQIESLDSACKKGILFLFVIGVFGLMTIWIWPLLTLWFGINLGSSDQSPPKWVRLLVLGEFFLYASFGVVQFVFYLPYLRGRIFEDIHMRFWWEQFSFDVFSVLSKLVLNFVFSWCFVLHKCGP